ncbi:MAG: monovalent cation/H(+) antiporter subunit G [Phycisphaerales bacterium]
MTIGDWAVTVLVFVGSAASLLAAIGIVRMPDLYTRMQSATKAGTLGVACVAAAAGVHFGTAGPAVQAVLAVLFLFATAPIASHLIARAAYGQGVPLWKQTTRNDLSELSEPSPEDR